ncbi:MAG: hypothetical protein E7484_06045 [Ruminococcaceae bacterium]|nr:hypothetical protein [Oscillospiraceae bacterium]
MIAKLGDVLLYEQPTKYIVESTDYSNEYKIPVLTAGQSFILGYTNETENIYTDVPVIIFDDFTTSVQYVDFPFKVKSSAMKILTANNANLKYLYYLLTNIKVDTGLHKRYWISKFADMVIDLPPLDIQNEIACRLDKLEDIISRKQQQLSKLDELVKSRFIELFGDRYTNDKKWDNKPLYECADFYNGKAHEQVVDENGEYILVTSRCIASDISDYRRTNALLFPLQVNDIAMVMSDVPNGRALAKCILIDEDGKYTLNQRICCLRNYLFNPIFFYHLLNRHEYFLSFNDGNAQTNLRKDDLLACNIIIPPLELQEQFALFVEQIDKSKLEVQKSLEQLETLKKSLMQQYFG